ncbi:type VII secretion-associated serine protease mycosin [Kribbella sp. NPDC056951]|uniref:type VII secretion-associated serine protease mycosin n=1 Tax=Kribbella sp. NPDC056951 TaxID=3345978 RepID=UPI0036321EFD
MKTHASKRICAALTAGVLSVGVVASPAVAKPPRGECRNAEPAHPVVRMLPWAQQQLMAQRAWRFTTGGGVLVAVVDSGVDTDHPQLRRPGKVLPGHDFYLVGRLPGTYDCVSHGTGVAGIIAADAEPRIGFEGIAPDARILPVRISERELNDNGQTQAIDQNILAQGIRWAVDRGARVINLSIAGSEDHAPVRRAVAYAVAHDVVVVAAVGNRQSARGSELPSYPASYPGVIGVGSITNAGVRANASQIGPYVDLVAPGESVLTTTRVGGHAYQSGTSFATPFVAGTAALVRAAWPKLTADQVARRLMATAAPAPGGTNSMEYGAGVVDPYRAVAEGMPVGRPAAMPAATLVQPDPHRIAAAAWWQAQGTQARRAALVAGGGTAIAILLCCLLIVGRRRRWAVTRHASGRQAVRADELPPEFLFARRPDEA